MKKTLVAAALLGTFAASAFAAPSVNVYGKIDTGLLYTHTDDKTANAPTDTVEMKSGWASGSRWGMTGTEDLGNAKVGFILESGFTSDDGASAQGGRLFGRQATVSVSGAYGTVYAGRIGSVNSDIGTIGMLANVSPFGSSFTDLGTHGSTGNNWDRYDNTIAYASPKIAGFYGNAMYSFKSDTQARDAKSDEGTSDATRYAAAGIGYKNGALDLVLTGDYTFYGRKAYDTKNKVTKDFDGNDGWSVVLGGNYNFGVATAYGKATYFNHQVAATDSFSLLKDTEAEQVKGWGVSFGAKVPVFGGNFLAEVGYRDARDVEDNSNDFKRWNATVGYNYAFSKRTSAYATGGWTQEKSNELNRTPNKVLVGAGLIHSF